MSYPFAAGADAEPIRRRGYFAERCRQGWQRVGPRHRVIHEARRQKLPTLRLVIAVLEQRLANPLGNSAVRLTVQDQRIDGTPDIVDGSVADYLHLARLGIYFDFADLRTVHGKLATGARPQRPTRRAAQARRAIAARSGISACLERRSSAFDGTRVAELLHSLRRNTIIGGAISATTKTFPIR